MALWKRSLAYPDARHISHQNRFELTRIQMPSCPSTPGIPRIYRITLRTALLIPGFLFNEDFDLTRTHR